MLVPIDVFTLGLSALRTRMEPSDDADRQRRMRNLALSYDAAGKVLGVFVVVGDFTVLPDDGRPRAAATPGR